MNTSVLDQVVRPWRPAAVLALALAALFPAAAGARVFQPGEFNDALVDPLKGVSLADRPDLIGQVIADLTVPFNNGMVLLGTIRTQVVREDVSGTLDFYYQMSKGIDSYTVSGFDHFSVDADFRTDLGHSAQGIVRSADGDTLTFVFVSSQGPTFVKTNATNFALDGTFKAFDDNGDPDPAIATVFAPVSGGNAIPLPTALLAAPIGFAIAGIAGWKARRKRA